MQLVARSLVVLLLIGCAASEPAPARAPEVRTTLAEEPMTGPPVACRLTLTETLGCQPQELEALFAPVRGRIEACRGASGGKLQLRVRNASGKLAFEVLPGSSLDARQRQCVLAALSEVHPGEGSTLQSGGASVPPTGFTSLMTLEW